MPTSPSLTTPQFIETNAGLAAASVATPVGPFVHITGFRVGDAFNYTPLPTDTDLNGNVVYAGIPDTYEYVGDNTINIICRIPPEAGPFAFGEVCVDLAGPVMFAKAVFDTLQVKYTSLGTNVLSTYTFNCLLKLQQPVAIFKIDTLFNQPPDVWEVDFWSDVYPPALQANPGIPTILVRELDENGNSSFIHQASDAHWSVGTTYHFVARPTVIAGTLTSVTVATLGNVKASSVPRNYVIETEEGYLRSCSGVTNSGNTVFTFFDPLAAGHASPVGSKISIFCNDATQTLLTITGDVSGSAIISGPSASINLTINPGAVLARSITYDVAGTYSFIVPAGVQFLYLNGCGAGAGGGGAGGGWAAANHVSGEDYQAGGGGGGGGAGHATQGQALAVTPGETITIVVGAKGIGGLGGFPGNTGTNGGAGGVTTVSGSFGTVTLLGGTSGESGTGFGPPSGSSGAGGQPGQPGGFFGIDGGVGAAGGNGGTGPFGAGGPGGRGSSGNIVTNQGADGGNGSDNGSGGGGGGGVYINTSTDRGGDGGDGTDGKVNFTW